MHRREGYPAIWPEAPEDWVAPEREIAAWVALAANGRLLGHVGLHRVAPGHAGWAEWCAAADCPPERLGELARLFVSPAARHTGLGTLLLETATADARRRGLTAVLTVGGDNRAAILFYAHRGWRPVGRLDTAAPPLLFYVGPPGPAPPPRRGSRIVPSAPALHLTDPA
jgi:GNAT superfamily N-acetyltransferase